MTSDHPEAAITETQQAPRLQKIETFPNLYRLLLPGDKPSKPTGFYYAVVKRGRKQFRRSLKTADRKLAHTPNHFAVGPRGGELPRAHAVEAAAREGGWVRERLDPPIGVTITRQIWAGHMEQGQF